MARQRMDTGADQAPLPLHILGWTARRKALRFVAIGELEPVYTLRGVEYFDRRDLADWGAVDIGGQLLDGVEWVQ